MSSLTVNFTKHQLFISKERNRIDLLAIRDSTCFILPAWIRLPNHSNFLRSPASSIEYDFTWLSRSLYIRKGATQED